MKTARVTLFSGFLDAVADVSYITGFVDFLIRFSAEPIRITKPAIKRHGNQNDDWVPREWDPRAGFGANKTILPQIKRFQN